MQHHANNSRMLRSVNKNVSPDSSTLKHTISTGYSHLALNTSVHLVGNERFAMLASKCHEIPAFADRKMKFPQFSNIFLATCCHKL
jgi:hypothetical protein